MGKTRAACVREQLDHPIIDADGHFVEVAPLLHDELIAYVEQQGGALLRERYLASASAVAPTDTSTILRGHRLADARDRWSAMPSWWGWPTASALDRATTHLPPLLHERLGELGIDVAILYPSMTIAFLDLPDAELAEVLCCAANRMHARMFAPYGDRLIAAALIPMHTPGGAIAVLDHALEHGLRAGAIAGFARRPIPQLERLERERGPLGHAVTRWDTFGLDSVHDYAPFWAHCVERRFAPVSHSSTQYHHVARSPSNYVYNHIGGIARAHEALAKSLLLGGVTRRFPELRVGFLEGGVAWACSLLADLVGHWTKRGGRAIEALDPERLDVDAVMGLFDEHGDARTRTARERIRAWFAAPAARPEQLDEFAAVGVESAAALVARFVPHFYFGCEADDPLVPWAFDAQRNPGGARLRAMLGSDIGHWDAPDLTEPVAEAWEQVERGVLAASDFRDFAFANAVRLHGGMNAEFFRGTVVEREAAALLGLPPRP